MPKLGCTKIILDKLTQATGKIDLAVGPAGPDDWYAHLLRLDRKQRLLFTHAETLYSFIFPEARRDTFRQFTPTFVFGLRERFRADGFSDVVIQSLAQRLQDIKIAATESRRILGSMNDMCQTAKYMLQTDRIRFTDNPWESITTMINRTPFKAIKYQNPMEQFLRYIGVTQRNELMEQAPNHESAIYLTSAEIELIRSHTFYPESQRLIGITINGKVKLHLSLEEIEELQGYVAAEANHAEDPKIQKGLDKIHEKLESYLES